MPSRLKIILVDIIIVVNVSLKKLSIIVINYGKIKMSHKMNLIAYSGGT